MGTRKRKKLALRISPAAAEFVAQMSQRKSKDLALVVSAYVVGTVKTVSGEDWNTPPLKEWIEEGRKLANSLPSKITVEYFIGVQEMGRLPQEDIHIVNGVKCYLPDEIIKLIGSREIVLHNGALQFEPKLGPREIQRNLPG